MNVIFMRNIRIPMRFGSIKIETKFGKKLWWDDKPKIVICHSRFVDLRRTQKVLNCVYINIYVNTQISNLNILNTGSI